MKLKDLCKIKHGYAFKGKDIIKERATKYVLVTPGNFNIGGGFKNDKCKYFSEEGEIPAEYILKENDLIVTMTDLSVKSDTLGYSALVPNDTETVYLHNQRIGLVYDIDETKVLKDYLYWFMRTTNYQQQVVASQSGTAIHHTSPDRILNIDIDLPSLEVQAKIVNILSNIENKINVNSEINNSLHELGKSIVINCENNSNNKIELYEITNFVNGYAFKNSDYNEDGIYKVITIKNVQDGYIDSSKTDKVIEIPKKMKKECILNKGDVLLSLTGNVGRIGIVYETDMLLNQRVAKFNPKNNEILPYLYFKFLNASMREILENISKGTAQQNLSPVETLRLKVPYDETMIQKSKSILNSIYMKIINLKIETKQLSRLRDELLPKLMNGEIDLDNIEI